MSNFRIGETLAEYNDRMNETDRRSGMRKVIIIGAVVIFLLVAGGLVVFGAPGNANTDSGVTACQNIADRAKGVTKANGEMTEASYQKTRSPFATSEHTDIQIAGTNLVDAIWEAQNALKNDDVPLATSMGIITKMEARYASLQIACQNHGVNLPALKS